MPSLKIKNPLILQARCPLCEKDFDPYDAKVVENQEDYFLLHNQCSNCGSYILSLVTPTPFGLSSVAMLSDLSASDVLKFKGQNRLTTDDVIEFHQSFVKNN